MKKIICILLFLGMLFFLCSCAEKEQPHAEPQSIYGTYLLKGMQVKTFEEIAKVQDEVNPDYPNYGKYFEGNELYDELDISWDERQFCYVVLHWDNTVTYSPMGGVFFGEMENQEIHFPDSATKDIFKYETDGKLLVVDTKNGYFYFKKVSEECEKIVLPQEGSYKLCSVLNVEGNIYIPEAQLMEQRYLPEEHFAKVSSKGTYVDIMYYGEWVSTTANKQMLIDFTDGQYAYSFSENYLSVFYDGKVLTYRLEK